MRSDRFVSDSGYVYTLLKIGLVGFVLLWTLYCLAPARDAASWRFRVFVAVYIALLLTISNSIYSIKTAALLFYLLGALDAAPILTPGIAAKRRAPRPRLRSAWPGA